MLSVYRLVGPYHVSATEHITGMLVYLIDMLQISLQAGLYHVYLNDWLKVFPIEQMFIINHESYSINRIKVLSQVTDFLGLGLYYSYPVTMMCSYASLPANMKRSANVGTMLGQRRRRWANIVPSLAERLVFAGTRNESIY